MEAKLFILAAVAISEVFSACAPSHTELENFQTRPKRSLPFEVSVSSKKCHGLRDFYYSWKLQEKDEKGKILQTSSKPSISINGYDFDSKKCFITSYLLTITVSHYPDMSYTDHASGIFKFEPDEMYIEIEGGVHRPHRRSKDLVVDAKKLSIDTSFRSDEDAFAGNIIKWETDPESVGFNFTNDLVQKLPNKYFEVADIYIFQVTVTRTKIPGFEDVKVAKQVITIVDEDVPEVNIHCFRNCILPNSLDSLVFIVECISVCEDLEYSWFVTPGVANSSTEFGNGHNKLKIKGKAFMEGETIYVTFSLGFVPLIATVTFASGLVKGNCTIDPDTGISGVTKFKIICTGFYSPNGLAVSMVYYVYEDVEEEIYEFPLYKTHLHKDRSHIKRILLSEYSFREVMELYLPPGDPLVLTVLVEDHAFLQAQINLTAVVEQYQPEENIHVDASLKRLVLSRDFTSITSYSSEGFYNEAVQLICCVLEAMKYYKINEMVTRDLHKHMVEAIMGSKPVRLTSAIQRLLILKKIMKFKLKTDTVTSKLIAEDLLKNILDVHFMHNHRQNKPLPHFYIAILFDLAIHISSDMLEKNDVIIGVLSEELAPHNYDSYDEFQREKIQIRDDYRNLVTKILIALQINCLTVLFKTLPDETEAFHETNMVAMLTKRKLLSSIKTKEFILSFFKMNKTKVILPPELMEELQKEYTYIDYQFGIFFENPFWWHKNISKFNTRACLFDLFLHCNKIRPLTTPFLLHLEILSVPQKMEQGTLSSESVVAYRVELESHVTLVVEFFNEGEHPHDYLVTWSSCVCTEDDFSSTRTKVIRREMSNSSRTLRVENKHDIKLIYLCIKKSTPMLSYRFVLATFSCMYWNIADEEWEKEGCRVIDPFFSMNGTLICECKHISLFIGEIIAPPTTVMLNLEINCTIGFVKNYVMVAFIIGLLLLWVVSLILAHLRDKSMKKKNVVYKLDDNVPGDSNPYLVVVFTGIFYDAQTTADVAFRIVGDKAKSRAHVIRCQGTTLLKRNSQDWLMLYTPNYLGHIKRLRIWHNSKGRYPHWYCDRVIVQDLKVGEQYCFTVKKWFSVIWGSGRIYREIRLKRPSTKMSNILFRTQFERDIKDKHIWMSVLSRDIQSNFNSKERVSTGFCFLFVSMLANALLYSVPHNAPADSIDAQSNFTILATNIIVFIESWLFATSVSFLIYFIFKNSAPL